MKRVLLSLIALALWCSPVHAQEWPARTVTIIVPFIAGSTPDSLARIVAEGLQERLGTPFVVENRAGASGNTGTAAAAKAAPDGHTLGVSIVGPLVINALLFAKMPYETDKDIAPISILASQPSVLIVSPGVAADSVESLLAAIRREPDKFTYGSIGRGSLSHLAMASLAIKAGVSVVHLPFAGSPAAVTALLRGDVQMAVLPAASVAPLGGGGQIEAAGGDVAAALGAAARPADAARGGHRRRRGRRLGGPDRPGGDQRGGAGQDSQGGRGGAGRAGAWSRSSRPSSWCRSPIRPKRSRPSSRRSTTAGRRSSPPAGSRRSRRATAATLELNRAVSAARRRSEAIASS